MVVVYRPQPSKKNGLKLSLFWKDWTKLLETLAPTHSDFVITGDLNFHLNHPDRREPKRFTKVLKEFGLVQHIRAPTHSDRNILDVLITSCENESLLPLSILVKDICLTDNNGELATKRHFMLQWELCNSKVRAKRKEIVYRDFSNLDIISFRTDLQTLNLFQQCSECSTVDDMVSLFNTKLQDLVCQHTILIRKQVSTHSKSPWYNDSLRELKRNRRQLERKYVKTRLTVDYQHYQKACKEYGKQLYKARISYDTDMIAAAEGDKGKLFSTIQGIIGKKSKKCLPMLGSDEQIAETFSSFFVNKIKNILSDLDEANQLHQNRSASQVGSMLHLMPCERDVQKLITYRQTNTEEVKKLILLSNNKYCSTDILPTAFIKNCVDILAPTFTVIINKSLSSGCVPAAYKSAVVKPAIKKFNLDQQELKNYRPVSNLPFPAKLLEKVVYSRLVEHLSANKLLSKSQSAYRSKHSTETLLLRLSNDILSSLDKGNATILVSLDISAAFDTVNHQMLIDRYKQYFGLDGEALQWMVSYLSERQQTVRIGSTESSFQPLETGFAQGSVLGGPKYNMFTTPLDDLVSLHGIQNQCYADDSNLYKSFDICNSEDTDQAITQIESCLADICTWMSDNRLKMNDDKTEITLFLPKKLLKKISFQSIEIRIGEHVFKPKDTVEILGVYLDTAFTMEKNINKITSSAWFQLRRISRVRPKISKSVAETLVNALVTSKIDYCNSLLCNLPAKSLKKLQRLQNAAARIIAKRRKYDHITPVLKDLHWLPIKFRTSYKLLVITFKAIHGNAPDYISELLGNRWNLRSAGLLLRTNGMPLTQYERRTFIHPAPHLWNSLPVNIWSADSVMSFKSLLKTYFFNQHYC